LIPLQHHFASRASATVTPSSPAPRVNPIQPQVPQVPHAPTVPVKQPMALGKVVLIIFATFFCLVAAFNALNNSASKTGSEASSVASQTAPIATPRPQTAAEKKAAAAAAAQAKKQQALQIKQEREQQAQEDKAAAEEAREKAAYEASIEMRGGDVALKTGYKARSEEYSTYITGTVINESDHPLRYAEVKFEITDKSGNTIESAMDNITYVAPKGSWKFKCIVMVDQAFRYRPVSVESVRAD
ncbi:MAG: FxLYD domain-containing protein, partial [Armatimonadota bacterium]